MASVGEHAGLGEASRGWPERTVTAGGSHDRGEESPE